ncbi:hypothetical protein NUSPORA_00289 [Nucleospora cyclopteri]
MFLLTVIFFIFGIFGKYNQQTSIISNLTLLNPHVKENGRNQNFIYDGYYTVLTKGYSNYTQLGYYSPNVNATLQSKEPIKRKNFKFEINFTLDNLSKGGRGFGFWISSPLKTGPFYGRNSDYKGFGVILDTSANSFLQFVDSDGTKGKKVYLKSPTFIQALFISHEYPRVSITYSAPKQKGEIIYEGNSNIQVSHVLGISGHTGNSSTVMKLFSIMGNSLTTVKKEFVAGESQKSSKTILFIGAAGILSLVYYLYTKQNRKNLDQLK